jgi:hypothetical protein
VNLATATATLAECFERFDRTCHRIEALDRYDAPGEAEALEAFQQGRPLPERSVQTSPWLANIQQTTAAGKSWSRTRVVRWPLTPYQRFQFSYGYPPSIKAGEVIGVADRTEHPRLAELDEFWLFDAEGPRPYVALMDYTETGAWLGCEVTSEPEVITRCRDQVRAASLFAVPLATFLESRHIA